MGETFLGSSQPLCLFLPHSLPLLLNSSRSTRQHGLLSMSSLPFLDILGEREPSILAHMWMGNIDPCPAFEAENKK